MYQIAHPATKFAKMAQLKGFVGVLVADAKLDSAHR